MNKSIVFLLCLLISMGAKAGWTKNGLHSDSVVGIYPIVKQTEWLPMASVTGYQFNDESRKKYVAAKPNSLAELEQYIHENIVYPDNAFHNILTRLIWFNLTLNAEGGVEQCTPAFTEIDSLTIACAICLATYPGWIPASNGKKNMASHNIISVSFSSSVHDPFTAVPTEQLPQIVPNAIQKKLSGDYLELGNYSKSKSKDKIRNYRNAVTYYERAIALGNSRALEAMVKMEEEEGHTDLAEHYRKQMAEKDTAQTDTSNTYKIVDCMPTFKGGEKAMYQYLNDHVKYPSYAYENNIVGRCICRFVVGMDGRITNVSVARSAGHVSLDAEAVRVIRSMPPWKPGIRHGKHVRVFYTIPINFQL